MAYNLPMQISLQKPDAGNIAEIKRSIENGLKYINLGTPTKTSIADIKRAIKAANIGNVSVVLSGPSQANLTSIKKTIEASLSSINIGIDAKIAELNKVAKTLSSASKSAGQQKELSPERAKNLNKKTDADIKRADKKGDAQVKKDLMQAAAIFKKSVSEAAARLEVALGKKQASVIVAKGVAKGKPASMLVESRGKADATRAVGDARAEVTRKRGDQKVIDDQKRADKQRVNDTKKSNAAIRRANRDQLARIAERNDPNSPANVRATARTTATVGTSNARTAAVNSKAAVDVQGKLAKDAATVAATNARAAATNVKATATVAATNARASATSIKAAATVAATNVKAAATVGVANARAAAISQKGINDTAVANARAAAIAQRAADQTKKNEASIANLRSKSISQINSINSSLERGAKSGNKFFDAIAGKAQSFAAYAVASTAIIKLSGFVTSATEDAIKYEKELINISQTTGDSIALTNVFSKSLENISKKYNVTLSKTAQLTRTLAQAGLSIREATQAAEILARTSLLAGFDNLTNTTEGFIAVMETFNLSVARAGKVLESINTISNAYAVESSDLVQAISRTGGAFAAAGGSVEELLALITAVRSTTRESAETISTGFRTIFARLERPKTIEYFKKLGIQLETAEGQFIGPYQSILAISKGLQELNIQVGSTKFAQIIEEIGGIRQISKVIPLLTQTKKAQEALNLAFDKGPETLKSIEKAQQGLGYRLGALQKEFAALIAQTVDSKGFKILADIFINLSKSVIQFASTLKPLLSLLAPVAALLAGRAAGQALQGGGLKNAFGPNKDVRRRNKLERQRDTVYQTGVPTQRGARTIDEKNAQLEGITTLKRASGGPVPGSGSGDTVPAMLTPGEFVINKKSAQAFGYGNLESVNKYAKGGIVNGVQRFAKGGPVFGPKTAKESYKQTQSDIRRDRYSARTEDDFTLGGPEKVKKQQKATRIATNTSVKSGIDPSDLKMLDEVINDAGFSLQTFKDDINDFVKEVNDDIEAFAQSSGDMEQAQREVRIKIGQRVKSTTGLTDEEQGKRVIGVARTIKTRMEAKRAALEANTQAKADRKKTQAANIASKNDQKAQAAARKAAKQAGDPSKTSLGNPIQDTLDLIIKLNSLGDDLDPEVVKGISTRLGRVSKSIEIAGQDYIKKAKAYNETIDPKTGQGDPLLKAMALGARDRYKATKASAGERKTQAITKAAQEGLPAEFGVAIVEMVDQINHLNGKVAKASEDLKKASEEEQKAIAAENKAKAKVLKDWMDSPLLASAGGSREDRLKEAQDIVKNSPDSPEVAAAKAATAKASASKQAAQAALTNANQKANQFTGAGGVLAGTNAGYQPPTPPVGPPVDAFIKAINKTTKVLNKLPTFIESAVYAQTVASTVSTVSGKEINQGALTTGMTKGAGFSFGGDFVSATMTRKNIAVTGKALEKLPGPIGKLGTTIFKNVGTITMASKLFAKGLNAASLVELGGGLVDSLFSTDYAKLRDQQVELGNSVAAAAAATRAYSQEFYRGIPLVGGFLSAFDVGSGVLEENLDSNGKLAVATARLAAEINRTSTESIRSQQKYSNAGLEQDIGKRTEGQNIAVQEQLDRMGLISQQSDELSKRREEASGASLSNSIGKGLITTGTGLGGSAFAGPAAPLVAAGSVIAGIGVAAYDYSTSLTMSTEQIVKSYEIQGKKLQQASEIQSKLISDFGTRVKNAAISSIRAGGNGYEQAIDNVSKQYGGKDKVKQITGGFEFTGDMAKDRTKLDEMINIKKSERESLESGLANINPSEKKQVAAQQDKINQAKAAEQTAIDLKNLVDQTYYAAEAEKVLMARRKVAAESMAYQIRIMKQLESAFDGLNSKFADLNNIAEELDNVGTGRLTNRQAASRVGLNSQLLETDARDIMRNPDLAMQADRYATEAGAQTKDDPEISNALGRINAIDAIGRMAKDKKLGDLLAPEGEAATDPKEIASTIKKQLEDQGYNVEGDKMLKEAIQTYSDKISQGYEYAAEAENDAREKATENAIKIIEKTQEAQNKVRDAEKQLRERQIELINRQLENAKAVYDADKSYFDERLSLNQKVSDALQTEPVGPKKAGFLGQKALATRNSQMAALSARTGGANIGQSISANTNRLNVLRNDKGNDNSVEMATLKGNLELLSQAVRDQIDIENQYLDGLIDMAKAQQEYTQSLYDAQGSIVRDLVTGTDQEVGQQLTTLNAAAIASQQGSFAGIPETLKKDIFSLFDQFGDVTIPGLGKTGRDAQREITKNEMMKKFGVDSATAEQLAKKAVNDKVPIDEKMAQQIENQRQVVLQSMNDEHNLKLNQIAMEVKNTEQFALGVMEFRATVNEMITKLGISPQNQPPNAIPNANQPVVMAPQNNNAAPQQVKMETSGEQTMTVNLAGLQAVATNAITAMIYEQVSQAFTNLSQETRTANNFEDLSNVFANAATKTQTVEMGNV